MWDTFPRRGGNVVKCNYAIVKVDPYGSVMSGPSPTFLLEVGDSEHSH